MRTLLRVELDDIEVANDLVLKGELQSVFLEVGQLIRPETSFFLSDNGRRSANFIFDMKDSSEVARISEIFYQRLKALVYFYPIMNLEELDRGLDQWLRDSGRLGVVEENVGINPSPS